MSLSPKRAAAIVASMTAVGITAISACSSSSNHSPPEINDAAAVTDAAETVQDEATTATVGDGASTDGESSVMCGSMTCAAPSAGILPITLSACCLPDNSCGATFGGALAAAGGSCLSSATPVDDPTCPSESIMGFSLAGCCTIDGICGDDLSMLGLGCNSASALLGGFGGGATGDASGPQPCGGDAGGSAPDAMPSVSDATTSAD